MLDFLTRLFFESQPLLLMFCAVAMAVALAVHRRRFTSRTRRGIWLTLAGCTVLLALQHVVVTDREAIVGMVQTLARAVDEGDVGTIEEHTDDSFTLDGKNKTDWIEEVNQALQNWQFDEVRVGGFRVGVEGDAAIVSFWARSDTRGRNQTGYDAPTTWKLHCIRRGDEWKMDGLLSAKVGLEALGSGHDIDLLRDRSFR
jgi:hypothetical protein